MNAFSSTLLFLTAALLVSCIRYPTESVQIPHERPTIAFSNVPPGATTYVDGLPMGAAADFDGKTRSLLIEPGSHLIEVRRNGKVVWSQRVFLGRLANRTFMLP